MAETKDFFTVNEAAEATGYSVPYFYTSRVKSALGYSPDVRPWLIEGSLLVALGLLDESGRATSDKNAEARTWRKTINELRTQVSQLEEEAVQLRLSVNERDAQIAVLKDVIASLGLGTTK